MVPETNISITEELVRYANSWISHIRPTDSELWGCCQLPVMSRLSAVYSSLRRALHLTPQTQGGTLDRLENLKEEETCVSHSKLTEFKSETTE